VFSLLHPQQDRNKHHSVTKKSLDILRGSDEGAKQKLTRVEKVPLPDSQHFLTQSIGITFAAPPTPLPPRPKKTDIRQQPGEDKKVQTDELDCLSVIPLKDLKKQSGSRRGSAVSAVRRASESGSVPEGGPCVDSHSHSARTGSQAASEALSSGVTRRFASEGATRPYGLFSCCSCVPRPSGDPGIDTEP